MYLDYYQLTKEPFYITPDPEFLFLSESHKQAMANTVYGIGMKKGLILIIGDIGVGKTMVAQSLLAKSDTEYLKTVYIDTPDVTFTELLHTVCQRLGLLTSGNTSEMVNTLHQYLLAEDKAERTVALFIDDAHTMPVETLDNLVVLSNLETKDKKLLQIVLLGQPKLDTLLNRNELRHIKQRVAIRTTLTALTPEESLSYVQHRLEKAGAKDTSAFTKTALKRILKEARGIPRVINTLCDNALVTAFGRQTKSVTPEAADEAITDLMGSKQAYFKKYLRWQTGALAAALCACIVVFAVFTSGRFSSTQLQKHSSQERNLQPAINSTPATPPGQGPVTQTNPQPTSDKTPREAASKNTNIESVSGQTTQPLPKASAQNPGIPFDQEKKGPQDLPPKNIAPKGKVERGKKMVTIKVKQGDSFIMLIKDFYGRTDKQVLALVKSKNPHIKDFHTLREGNILYFPNPSDVPQ